MKTRKMKIRKMAAVMLSSAVAVSAVVSVSAAELTQNANENKSEVVAKIAGEDEPGDVSYIITIPDKLDFGTLTIPENDSQDHFKDISFDVKATEVNGLTGSDWYVRVKVKDQSYKMDEEERFFITQKTVSYPGLSDGQNKFVYSFNTVGDDKSLNSVANNRKDESGFNVAFFNTTGQKADCTLRINQNQLYGRNVKEIAGEYNGSVVFHSSIVNGNIIK